MVWKFSQQNPADYFFSFTVSNSDRGLVGLQFDFEIAAVIAQNFPRRGIGGREGIFEI